jgi:hypothetical protein
MTDNPKSGPTEEGSPKGSPSARSFPDSYYVGQEYIEDPEKIEALIKFKFRSAVVFSNIDFDHRDLHVRQIGRGEVVCTLHKTISKRLFDTISSPKNAQSLIKLTTYILGYIRPYLPSINERIQQQKYLDGHILARTISLFDIYDVAVVNSLEDKGGIVLWPIPATEFPSSKLSTAQDAVFIRDLIDAMTSYFQYDLDGCVRKVITSLENCFSHYALSASSENLWSRLKASVIGRRTKIRRLVNEYVKEGRYHYTERDLKVLRENILFIYGLRNLVVHDKLRINPSQAFICRKAIGTLLYLFQGNFLSDEHRAYIFSFYGQFIVIDGEHSGTSLELVEWNKRIEESKKGPNLISSTDALNKWMFETLKITRKERKSIPCREGCRNVTPRSKSLS